jgi:hypothetical protein
VSPKLTNSGYIDALTAGQFVLNYPVGPDR